jgi:hypothetical protein
MLLPHQSPEDGRALAALAPEDTRAHHAFVAELDRQLRASGELIARGCAVRGGYWLVDCPGMARAVEIAARLSAAPGAGGAPLNVAVEVRPVMRPRGEEM